MKIEELNLSLRAYNCLKRNCINRVEQIVDKSREDLMDMPGVGFCTASEIIARLKTIKMTNADRIRTMNDEELATFIREEQCNAILLQRIESIPAILDHLQQSAKKEGQSDSLP